MLSIGILGINFKTADISLRETMAHVASTLSGKEAIFFHHPIVVLSTCNRTEIYFSGNDLALIHSDLLAYLRKNIEESFEMRLYSYFGIDCFAHLCHVVAGLDSAVLGETEIQGQVKQAYARAKNLPSSLHFVFQKALKVGKLVRSQLEVRWGPSMAARIWQMTEWEGKSILLIGYSEINRSLLSFLIHKGIVNITLCTRSSLILGGDVTVVDRSELTVWQKYDVIVAATSTEEYIVCGEGKNQCLFDLGVPRNIDPAVGKTTTLYNIDQIANSDPNERNYSQLIWENVIKLSQIYRFKSQRGRESVEMELHL